MKENNFVYLITDTNMDFNKLLYKVESALCGGVKYLQYRKKSDSAILIYKEALAFKKLCNKYKVPLIINDRVDIALAVDAEGIHIGLEDLPVNIVRGLLPKKILGVTAKTLKQAVNAQNQGADYLGVGALFKSTTKPNALSMSSGVLKSIRKRVNIKLFGIGGISIENINKDIIKYLDGVAISSAILHSNDPEEYIKLINELFLYKEENN